MFDSNISFRIDVSVNTLLTRGGKVVKKGIKSVHVVIEWPLSENMLTF